MTTAFVYPGQGAQSVGMLADYYQNDLFTKTCATASKVLGFDVFEIVQADSKNLINDTRYTQPVLLATSVAVFRIWQNLGGTIPKMVAGHSLGEYTALVAAGAIAFEDALQLVTKRAQCMVAAVADLPDTSMAAVIGLADETVEAACQQAANKGVVQAVNYNSPGQVVIAGEADAVAYAGELAKEAGAKKVQPLAVSVPSHCELMRPAAKLFEKHLNEIKITTPEIPVVHNFDGNTYQHPDDIRQALSVQLYMPVRWVRCIENLRASGMSRYIECGPGKVLTGLIKRIDKSLALASLSSKKGLSEVLSQ